MATLTWGAGGGNVGSYTSAPGGGWYTNPLGFPLTRQIYDGTRPIWVAGVYANAGTGDRYYRYSVGTGWLASGFHFIAPGSSFAFGVFRNSGQITLGLLRDGSASKTYWHDGTAVAWPPNGPMPGGMTYYEAPSACSVISIVPNNAVAGQCTVNFNGPSDNGGTAITNYTHQIATDPGFSNVIHQSQAPYSGYVISGLPTGVVLYHRVMATNHVTENVGRLGGAASSTWSFQLGTAPVTAPGITIVMAASGTSAVATMSPPSDTGGIPINGYDVEYEYLSPAPIPTPATQTVSTANNTAEILGTVAGATYRWRARAKNAAGVGPYSAWTQTTMPKPSTNPGDYFDGSTVDVGDVDYVWAGAVNNSISRAQTLTPTGWGLGGFIAGGSAVVSRATGALDGAGAFAARVVITEDVPMGMSAGIILPYTAVTTPGSVYTGSIKFSPPRDQRVAAAIVWFTAANAYVATSYGPEVVVVGNSTVTLSVSATAPPTGVRGVVRVQDFPGTGWSPWLAGESYLLDGAMLTLGGPYPYFDGSFTDTDEYDFAWEGVAHASVSVRGQNLDPVDTSLVDPDCPPVPQPPRPPVVPNDCIVEVGQWRRYWYGVSKNDIRQWFQTVPTVFITTNAQAERQMRVRFYQNPFDRPLADLDPDEFCSEIIVSYLPANTVLTLDGVSQRAWASVNGGPSTTADHLLYGSNGMPAEWPVLDCGIGYYMTVDVPLENQPGNITLGADLRVRY